MRPAERRVTEGHLIEGDGGAGHPSEERAEQPGCGCASAAKRVPAAKRAGRAIVVRPPSLRGTQLNDGMVRLAMGMTCRCVLRRDGRASAFALQGDKDAKRLAARARVTGCEERAGVRKDRGVRKGYGVRREGGGVRQSHLAVLR